jgi:transketolase
MTAAARRLAGPFPTGRSSYRRATVTAATAAPEATESLTKAANEARGLAMDAIAAAKSGHLGLPLGAAEVGAVLFGEKMQYNPEDPQWINRDRFILSAGHGSMFLYSWLHLAGYDLPLDELKQFRQMGSMTPGHPEFPSSHHNTPGIESTTGPLGQGVANAVGMAAAAKMAGARYNTEDHEILDHSVIALCGDGCLQEGCSAEAAAIAAHEKLDNLIYVYDANDVTLDKMADFTQSEDVGARFEAYGWDVVTIDGHDLAAISSAVDKAKTDKNGKPKLIICKTIIGKGIDAVAGTNAAHGEAGVEYVDDSKSSIGLPDEKFFVSEETRDFFAARKEALKADYDAWQTKYAAWKDANADLAKELQDAIDKKMPTVEEMFAEIPEFEAGAAMATRASGSEVLQGIAKACPMYVSGSADLHGSNKNYIKGGGDFGNPNSPPGSGKTYAGRNLYYGIREHAMGSMLNGFAYYGLFRVSGATFLVFVDYLRAPVRVAALSELPVGYILTHDSIGVGEDGPTHQPVETVSGLRVMPNLDVIRPADSEETAGAFVASVERLDGPTALILTRQNVPDLDMASAKDRRYGTLKGGYVLKKESGDLDMIIIAAGSEVQHATKAAESLGDGVRVVSMPCMERFDRQDDAYKAEVLPAGVKTIAMEAGVDGLWYKYADKVVGVNRFGISAPGDEVMEKLGMTADNLLAEIKSM